MSTAERRQRDPQPRRPRQAQGGGFVLGLIVGLLVGLALALGVALYVTKVPIPFVNKVPQRSGDRDAEERERNRNWDPNSPLYGGNPAKPAAPATNPATNPVTTGGGSVSTPDAAGGDATTPPATATAPSPAASRAPAAAAGSASARPNSARDPAAILADRPTAVPPAPADTALSTKPRDDPFTYFVQAGAYGRPEDAEQQRAKLAMLGIESRVTEREQAGRTVYRVRMGPFERRELADSAKERLESAAIEAQLVRVQK